MKAHLLVIAVFLAASAAAQDKVKRIGEIEFFGSGGIDLNKLRAALPFHEGDEFRFETMEEKLRQSAEAVKQVTGHSPTDMAPTCCDDRGNWIIYVGVSRKTVRYNPPPKGASPVLPKNVLNIYERFMSALMEGVQAGKAAEDRSKGYALSEYPPLRSTQLEMRAYAVGREALLRTVLEKCRNDQQRIVASELLGFARQSRSQLNALVQATHDGNGTVRNNATRALLVLVDSNSNLRRAIPVEGFIHLLSSGTWTDLNKTGSLLELITRDRNPTLLARLRKAEVQESLIEMARWRTGHAGAARYILGRIAGVDEELLQQLVTSGDLEEILSRLQHR